MSENKPIQLGLCCLNTILRKQTPFPIFASRKMIIRTIKEKGIHVLKAKIIQNLKDVLTMMDWNEENGIKVFRLSSEMFPHKSNPKVVDYDFDFAKDLLKQIGEKSKKYNQRLTFHPGQYNVIGTPNEKAFQQTINDLSYHADVLDLIGAGKNSVMVIHGGGIYGDKKKTKKRWCEQYQLLPEKVKKRLVLENCEKCFSIIDCLQVSKKVNIPVVFSIGTFVHNTPATQSLCVCWRLARRRTLFESRSSTGGVRSRQRCERTQRAHASLTHHRFSQRLARDSILPPS